MIVAMAAPTKRQSTNTVYRRNLKKLPIDKSKKNAKTIDETKGSRKDSISPEYEHIYMS